MRKQIINEKLIYRKYRRIFALVLFMLRILPIWTSPDDENNTKSFLLISDRIFTIHCFLSLKSIEIKRILPKNNFFIQLTACLIHHCCANWQTVVVLTQIYFLHFLHLKPFFVSFVLIFIFLFQTQTHMIIMYTHLQK